MSALFLALIAAQTVSTPVDAERAFATDAQRIGQWTAFRKWADPDAVMFTPQAVWARDFLKGRKDPAKAVNWWPTSSIMSCDGRSAVNRGRWTGPAIAMKGVFTTVWQVDKANWRWVYDGAEPDGARVAGARSGRVNIRRASCRGRPTGSPAVAPPALSQQQAGSTRTDNGRGQSADRTLGWDWKVQPNGARSFRAYLWNGRRYETVIDQKVPPPAMMELFGSALVTFLVIIDPPGCAPIFASLTRGTPIAHRRAMAVRSCLVAWAVLMFFALLGRPMLQALGISLASFRIAGGVMLFMIALDMVFERRTARREERAHAIEGTPEAEDISVFPMAIPMLAGPGSIASAMLWVSRAEGGSEVMIVLAAITVVILLTLLALLAAGRLMQLIGERIEAMITRILGVILAALAAQFIVDGLRQSFPVLAGAA